MIEWSTVFEAMRGARRRPVRGRVTAHQNSQIHIGCAAGVPFMPVFLHPEGLDLIRAEGSLRLNRPDGTPHLLIADGRAWDFSKDPECPVTAESRFAPVIGPGYELISVSDQADEALSSSFPSGPVRSDHHLGRPTWVVPGVIADVEAEIVVDQQTGVVLRAAALDGDWSAGFSSIEFPEAVDPATFRWDGESTEAPPVEFIEREDGSWTVEDVAVPEPEEARGGRRVLSVRMETWLIEDGSVAPPRVGDTVAWALTFIPDDDDDAVAGLAPATLVALATPAEDRPPREDRQGVLRWPAHLQGDGWSATWAADRPVVGAVRVRGQLWIDSLGQAVFPVRQTETRGRVSRDWSDGTRVYPVDVAVELDLDTADPPEPRPRVVPGPVVVHGRTMWVADHQVPVVVRVDLETGAATETVLPLPVATRGMFSTGQLSLRPDDTGCWVLSGDRRYRIDGDSTRAVVDPQPLGPWSACAYDGRTMLVLGESPVLMDAAGSRRPIEVPEWGAGLVVAQRRVGDSHFVAALRVPDVPMRQRSRGAFTARYVYRLATIDDHGVVVGPEVEFDDRIGAVGIVDGRVWVVAAGAVHTVNGDLSLDTVHRLPTGPVLEAGFVGNRMWTLGHHPDGATGEDGRWRFTLLELPGLQPTVAMAVSSNYLHVTEDAEGTVWVPGRRIRGLRTDGTVACVDVAEALGR